MSKFREAKTVAAGLPESGVHPSTLASFLPSFRFVNCKRLITSLSLDVPARISLVFYAGLEGIGGLDMETDENENVSHTSAYFAVFTYLYIGY
jgi:hypothetical protein